MSSLASSEHEYACLQCGRRSADPLDVILCRRCGDPYCAGCRPVHQARCQPLDADGLSVQQRFESIRGRFFVLLWASGNSRAELYTEKRGSAWGMKSEEDLVQHWAEQLRVPVHQIFQGIDQAFKYAQEKSVPVTSFKFCMTWIVQRIRKGTPQ